MAAFSVFEDSPTRPTGSAFTFRSQTSLSINSAATTPNVDKENVNPLTCVESATRAGKKSKRKYAREEGAGPLSMKKKVKTAIIGSGSSPVKNAGRKRRALGGVSNTLAPRPLAREETVILDDLVDAANRRAVELTVSPLADASEAYLSMPGQSVSTNVSSRDISPTNSAYMEDDSVNSSDIADFPSYFTCSQSSEGDPFSHSKLSPLMQSQSLEDQMTAALETQDNAEMMVDICLQIPLPPSP